MNIDKRYKARIYENDEVIKNQILDYLDDLLSEYNYLDLKMPIYTCINELLLNAVKANFKNIYFEKYLPKNNALDIVPYRTALELFKLEMTSKRVSKFIDMARKENITADIYMISSDNLFIARIENPAVLTDIEISNIKSKYQFAESYENLTDYLTVNYEDSLKEGGGLGIIFVIMMLRSFGLSSDHFVIRCVNNSTIAELKIPLNDNTINSFRKTIGEKS